MTEGPDPGPQKGTPMAYTMSKTPKAATWKTGPGWMEDVKITTWTSNGWGKIALKGTVPVYCGAGGVHTFALNAWDDAAEHAGADVYDAAEVIAEAVLADEHDGCDCFTD